MIEVNAHALPARTTGQKSTNVQVEVFTDVEVFGPIYRNSRHSIFSVPLTVLD
jgi:hypothetical protein